MINAVDDRGIQDFCVCNPLAYSPRHCQCVQMKQILLGQFLHHRRDAARLVQILHVMCTGRAQLRNVRSASADFIKERRRELNTCFVCDCRKVKDGVGRSANPHINGDGILECITCHYIARANILSDEIENNGACHLGEQTTFSGIRCRYCPVPGKPHAEHLGQRVHGVCGKKPRTRTTAGAGMFLDRRHFLCVHLSGGKHAGGLECLTNTDVAPVMAACQHRSSADQNGRNVQTCCRHQHSRNNLVAVWNQNKSIKARRHGNGLNRIGDQLTAGKGVFHPCMPHCNSITHTDGRKFNRCAAGSSHAEFYGFRNRIEMKMTGNNLIE